MPKNKDLTNSSDYHSFVVKIKKRIADAQASTNATDTINNQDLGHTHGMCNPLKALNGESVDAIVVGGIGAGAINKLNAMGVKVYRACEGTVRDNINLFQNSIMPEMSKENACAGHVGDCGH